MKQHSLFFAVILSFTCGCFQYTPPTPVLLSNKFTPANHSASDEILLSLSVLTLNDARKIALQNNQNYRAAYLMVDAQNALLPIHGSICSGNFSGQSNRAEFRLGIQHAQSPLGYCGTQLRFFGKFHGKRLLFAF